MHNEQKNVVYIYSDGACSGNPGRGGWGAVLRFNGHQKDINGYVENTTNNQMELMGAIESLKALKRPSAVVLTTDSQYVCKGMNEWIEGWIKKGWKNSSNKPVKNMELWKELHEVSQQHNIEWKWIKGHAGFDGNEQADRLAVRAIQDNT